jgi:hypothetical protein
MPCDYAPDYAKNHECENGEIVKRTSAWRNCPTTLIEHGFSPDRGEKRPWRIKRLHPISRLPNCRKLERGEEDRTLVISFEGFCAPSVFNARSDKWAHFTPLTRKGRSTLSE